MIPRAMTWRPAVLAAWFVLVAAGPTSAQAPTDTTAVPPATPVVPMPSPARAPDVTSTPAAATASLLRGGAMGELLSVYVPRAEADIQSLLEDARREQHSSSDEIDRARRLANDADGRVKIMQEELETTKVRRNVAKKATDRTSLDELDRAMKKLARERHYLQRLRDPMRADADRLEAEREASAARVKALELEL